MAITAGLVNVGTRRTITCACNVIGDSKMTATNHLPVPSRHFIENCDWIDAHMIDLIQKYPNQWVAVHSGRVLAADPDRGVVSAHARQCAAPEEITYDFINDGSMIF